MVSVQDKVQLIKFESERLTEYLGSLSPDSWTLPSACGLWEIRDVAAHLVMVAEFYSDVISRGLQGDSSPTEGFPPAGTLDPASFDGFIAERSIAIRESLGEDLLATFGTKWG